MANIYAYQETIGDKFWHLIDLDGGNAKIDNGEFYIGQLVNRHKDGSEVIQWDRMAKHCPVKDGKSYPVPCVIHYEDLNLPLPI